MRVNFDAELTNLEGKPINEIGGPATVAEALTTAGVSALMIDQAMAALRPFWGTGEPVERKLVAHRAIGNALQQNDAAVSGADKIDRIRLAIKVMDPKQPVEVSEKERETIMKAVDKVYGPLVYTRIHELFNPPPAEKAAA